MLPILLAAALSAPASAAAGKPAAAATKQVLPWIENDWNAALAAAKTRNVPLFVEAWAPW